MFSKSANLTPLIATSHVTRHEGVIAPAAVVDGHARRSLVREDELPKGGDSPAKISVHEKWWLAT